MTDFEGLLPARDPAPPLPDRGGAAAVARVARSRRRRRLAGAGAGVALALAAALLVLPDPGPAGLEQDPTSPGEPTPAVTATPTPTPTATPLARRDAPAAPGGRVPDAAPTPSAIPASREPGSPAATAAAQARWTRWAPIERTTVPDRPDENCVLHANTFEPTESLCVRYLGKTTEKAGTPMTLVLEFCAQTVDVPLEFGTKQEVRFAMLSPDDGDWSWDGVAEPLHYPHSLVVRTGTCLRYTAFWHGRGDDRKVAAPGTYELRGFVLADSMMVAEVAQAGTITLT